MTSYIKLPQDVQAELTGNCFLCFDPLNIPSHKVVAHEGDGLKHPIHLNCALDLLRAGLKHCPVCRTECDIETLYSRSESINFKAKKILSSWQLRSAIKFTALILLWKYTSYTMRGTPDLLLISQPQSYLSLVGGAMSGLFYSLENRTLGIQTFNISRAFSPLISSPINSLDAGISLVSAFTAAHFANKRKKIYEVLALVIIIATPYFSCNLRQEDDYHNVALTALSFTIAFGFSTILKFVERIDPTGDAYRFHEPSYPY